MLEKYNDVLTVAEISEILQVSKHLVRSLIKNNNLKGFTVGREYRVSKKELVNYINNN